MHEHEWMPQPEFSGQVITRYMCKCGAWGWRHWPRPGGHVPAIRVYADGFHAERYREVVDDSQDRLARERARIRGEPFKTPVRFALQ